MNESGMDGADRQEMLKVAMTVPALGWAVAEDGAWAVTSGDDMGPGVSLALARQRAGQLSDASYGIAIELTATDRAEGNKSGASTIPESHAICRGI